MARIARVVQGKRIWLLNHRTYEAQTAVCSSYGLMQVMYTTAVEERSWRHDQPPINRDPVDLFDPDVSLDLGVGYDASFLKKEIQADFNSGTCKSLEFFNDAMWRVYALYNSGGLNRSSPGELCGLVMFFLRITANCGVPALSTP